MTDTHVNAESSKESPVQRINGSSPNPNTGKPYVKCGSINLLVESVIKVKIQANSNGQSPQPVYNPQQIDGSPRPQILRIDSRSTLGPRPPNPIPLARFPQPRQPGSPGVAFPPRPQSPQQRFPISNQNIPQNQGNYQPSQFPRPSLPFNGGNIINTQRPPLNLGPNLSARPPLPIQRPPGQFIRQPGLFQQRSVPANINRPPFINQQPQRSFTLDSSDPYDTQNTESKNDMASANSAKGDSEKPTLSATKSRSISGNEPIADSTASHFEERRPISSLGNVQETEKTLTNISNVPQINRSNELKDSGKTQVQNIQEDKSDILKSATSNVFNVTAKQPTTSEQIKTSETSENLSSQNVKKEINLPPPKTTEDFDTKPSKQQREYKLIEDRKTPDFKQPPSHLTLTKKEGDNDSGVDESTQGNDILSNGDHISSKKSTRSSTPRSTTTPTKNKSFTRGGKSPSLKSPGTPTSTESNSTDKKKVPMNKIQVGAAPSPNLKVVKSKIGSLQNSTHKPGGGNIKIENRKIDFSTTSSRIAAKNDTYTPGGGDKKIQQQKLAWSAKSKIGSLENTTHKPKGGDKKIESVKLDFKDKAKSKVGSKDNMKHVPGGGDVKTETEREDDMKDIENKKLDIKVQSKIDSLANIKHKPGGGEKKIFDDKEYIRQMSAHSNASLEGSHKKNSRPQSLNLTPIEEITSLPTQQRVKILDEIEVHTVPRRSSSRLSRSNSARSARSPTPRPRWRY